METRRNRFEVQLETLLRTHREWVQADARLNRDGTAKAALAERSLKGKFEALLENFKTWGGML